MMKNTVEGLKVRPPWWLGKMLYKKLVWKMPVTEEPAVYLTFDDGPHATATPFVLEQLDKYNAKASFFCIGKNVVAHPDIYKSIIAAGHTTGNHTFNHMNGWESKTKDYISNIKLAEPWIDSKLFRPPYGKIKRRQIKALTKAENPWTIYMWSILSCDFDANVTPRQCTDNVLENIAPGLIVVFHDSAKAWDRMQYALPKVLQFCKEKNWSLKALPKD
jgi:peptidoglycan/xylan/chitin deacetylase (PgdA/CDA1 family)